MKSQKPRRQACPKSGKCEAALCPLDPKDGTWFPGEDICVDRERKEAWIGLQRLITSAADVYDEQKDYIFSRASLIKGTKRLPAEGKADPEAVAKLKAKIAALTARLQKAKNKAAEVKEVKQKLKTVRAKKSQTAAKLKEAKSKVKELKHRRRRKVVGTEIS